MDNCKTVGDVIAFLQTKDPEQELSTPASHQLFQGTKEWYFGFYTEGELRDKPLGDFEFPELPEEVPVTCDNCLPGPNVRFNSICNHPLTDERCGITKRMRESRYISATTPPSSSGKCWIKPVTSEELFGQRTGGPCGIPEEEGMWNPKPGAQKDFLDRLAPSIPRTLSEIEDIKRNTYQKPAPIGDAQREEMHRNCFTFKEQENVVDVHRKAAEYLKASTARPLPKLGDTQCSYSEEELASDEFWSGVSNRAGHVDENLCANAKSTGVEETYRDDDVVGYIDHDTNTEWGVPVITGYKVNTDTSIRVLITQNPEHLAAMLQDPKALPIIQMQLVRCTWSDSVEVTDGNRAWEVSLEQA